MPTFHEPCSPLHQGEGQSGTELFLRAVPFYIALLVVVVGMVGEGEGVMGGERGPEEQLSTRLPLALMKWTARFTKRWHLKNRSGHGGNPRNA
ncbi:hypothetical protein ALC57_09268 [Trachymyrmex cornetzi]|uniref:Uncharacterized protein n=1 Tax=Trachymyrmex cornetzi TaxID=471704 RepID=A0A151J5S3_9HYME|nr:hypothetical protein ALC57_09268 [Trachymyrmex cornetzi]